MKTRTVLLAAALLLARVVFAEDKPFDFSRAKEIYERSQRGETLNADEQKYLEEAKRRFQERSGLSSEQMEKLRVLHEKSQRGETLTAEEQKMLDEAKAKMSRNGGNAEASGDNFDWNRAKEIYQRHQRGEKLSAEDQKYLDEALRRRGQGQRGGDRGDRSSGGSGGQPVTDPAVLKELVPLPELSGSYKGQDGGLYGGGKNEPPADLQARATKAVAEIRPLNGEGKPDAGGKIVLLSMGMSNTTMEFSAFVQKANADPRKADNVVIVDGAQGGKDATAWATADAPPWSVAEQRMKSANVTPKQVQVIWIKQALIRPSTGFPAEADRLHDRIAENLKLAKEKYPNLRLVFLSSRTYGGYATTTLNPEPYAYEGAFAVRRLIQEQMKTDAVGPVLLWGPYIWAAGDKPNQADGFNYAKEDVVEGDHTHPSKSGREKVANSLLAFFTGNPNATSWFVKKSVAGK